MTPIKNPPSELGKYLFIPLLFFAACNKSCFEQDSVQTKYLIQQLNKEAKEKKR